MGLCANTSCGAAYLKNKAVKEMNSRGVYTPEQIEEALDVAWEQVNPDNKVLMVNKAAAQKMVEHVVNHLGSIGDGKQFDAAVFEKNYKVVDKKNAQKNTKQIVE